ncbi:MAG: hypothetical protein ACLQM8_21720 [Limisphaerales bacterium]
MRLTTFSRVVWVIGVFITSGLVSAKDIYIAQTAQGSGNGTSAANAYAVSWFNTAGNWGSGSSQISPGDTVHLCGTITSVLTIQASGTASAQTTIYFESGANITVPSFPQYINSGQINGNGKSYYTIDGGGHGWMTATASTGNSGSYPAAIVPGLSGSVTGVTIQNLTITNVYNMQNNANGDSTEATAIFAELVFTGFTVRGCTLANAYSGIELLYQSGRSSNVQIYSNTITHCNWLTRVAPLTGTSIMDTVLQHHNIGDYVGTEYDDSNDNNHHDGFFWDASAVGSWTTNVSIFGNVIGPHLGAHTTAHIYFSAAGGGGHHAVEIYNNVFFVDSSVAAASPGNGFIYLWGVTGNVYNNTLNDARNGSGACIEVTTDKPALVSVQNNVITGCNACVASAGNIGVWNYNLYLHSGGAPGLMNNQTWSGWQGSGNDTHSIVADPQYVNATAFNFAIQSASPAIGATAQNFTSLFTTDIAGTTRPSTGNWTMGAYLYGSAPVPPAPPTDLQVTAGP